MEAAVWFGANDIRVEERQKPFPRKGEVLIKVREAGICGTDLMIYTGKFPRSRPPLTLGHEFAGEVVATGDIPSDLKSGDRVVVNPLISCGRCVSCKMGFPHVCVQLRLIGVDTDGSFAEFVRVSWEKVYRIPSDCSFETGALIEPIAVALHGVARSCCEVGDQVVVLGAGPIGLLLAMISKTAGASKVIVTEVLRYRLELAEKFGFDVIDSSRLDVLKEVLGKTNGTGADIVFEAAAVPQTASQLVSLVRPRGRIIIVGLYKQPPAIDLLTVNFKEEEIIGSRVYSERDFERAVHLAGSGRLHIEHLITHRLDLQNIKEGFRLLEHGKDVMKVMLSL